MKSSCNIFSARQQGLDLLAATRYWPKGSPPRRDRILAMLDSAVDWTAIEAMIRPYYESDVRRRGRPGHSLKMMVKITALGWLWGASDRALENGLLDSKSWARFVGTDPWTPRPPSAAAIRSFRSLLQRTPGPDGIFDLHDLILDALRGGIHSVGLEVRAGVISEPLFRRSPRPSMRPAPAIDSEGEAQ